jgi:uncharacterized protein (DUF736 family)
MSNESKMFSATGLWKQQSKNGKTYLSGSLGGVRVLIFPNEKKTADNQPDYTLCFAPNEKREAKERSDADDSGF